MNQHTDVNEEKRGAEKQPRKELPLSRYVSIPELAAITGIPESWYYERSRQGKIPGQYRFGKYVRVNLAEFEAKKRELCETAR